MDGGDPTNDDRDVLPKCVYPLLTVLGDRLFLASNEGKKGYDSGDYRRYYGNRSSNDRRCDSTASVIGITPSGQS